MDRNRKSAETGGGKKPRGLRAWWKRVDDGAREKNAELWKIFLWLMAGLISTFPELAAYMVCLYGFRALHVDNLGPFGFMERIIELKPDFSPATVVFAYMLSTAIGYTVAYILNRKTTFRANNNIFLSTFLYALTVIFTIFMNGLLVGPFISGMVGRLAFPAALRETASKLLCMLVPGLWTYPLNRFVIYRVVNEKKDKNEIPEKEETPDA